MPSMQVPAWQVTGQQERLVPQANGQVVSGVVITFTTAGGNTGSVFVPDAQYTPDAVARAVAARAAALDTVGSLRG